MKDILPIWLGIISSVLITIGAFIPGWLVLVYPTSGYRVYVSLFYGLTCLESCRVYGYEEVYSYSNKTGRFWMIEFQVEVLLSILLPILSVFILFVYRRGIKGGIYLLASFLLFVIGGVIVLYACGRILNATLQGNIEHDKQPDSDLYFLFPFSLAPVCVGGILQLTASILVVLIRRRVTNIHV